MAEDSSSIFDETYEVPWRLPCGQLFQLVQQLLDLGLKGSLSRWFDLLPFRGNRSNHLESDPLRPKSIIISF